jgi:hypothetical protein
MLFHLPFTIHHLPAYLFSGENFRSSVDVEDEVHRFYPCLKFFMWSHRVYFLLVCEVFVRPFAISYSLFARPNKCSLQIYNGPIMMQRRLA